MKRFGVVRTVVVLAMLVLLGTLASAQTANTSSGDRKGFIVGIGGGIGLHRIPDRGTGGSVDRTALAGGPDFKIGYAPTDQFLIHYSAKAAITQAANYDAIGVSGFGVTYLIRPTSPSFFVTAIAGEGGALHLRRQ